AWLALPCCLRSTKPATSTTNVATSANTNASGIQRSAHRVNRAAIRASTPRSSGRPSPDIAWSAEQLGEPLGPQVPPEKSREADEDAEAGEEAGHTEQPLFLGERGDGHERDAHRQRRFADVELIVLHVE